MLIALDIETKCNRNCDKKCDCALYPQSSIITIIGGWCSDFSNTWKSVEEFEQFRIDNSHFKFVGHNFKFDLNHLQYHGSKISIEDWAHDTQIMASACLSKIPPPWLESYEQQRKEANKLLPRGYTHREAKGQSLKTLAPYFLNVEPFWEDPTNHAQEAYVLKDCEYTYRLFELLKEKMNLDHTFSFYEDRLLPWAKMLYNASSRGIAVDLTRLSRKEFIASQRLIRIKRELDSEWKWAYQAYKELCIKEIEEEYKMKEASAIERSKDKSLTKLQTIKKRYNTLFNKRLTSVDFSFNINSDDQMLWLLKDYFKCNTEVRVRNKETNIIDFKNSTGVEVLNRLANEGRKDIQLLLEYREYNKLLTSFYPSYRNLMRDGVIHTNFNITGTRTGRLSSSEPNLQQVPGHLHSLFIARPGYKLACFDESGIEARLIAFYTEDKILCELIRKGEDIHGFHAKIFFDLKCNVSEIKKLYPEKRQLSKNVGFGLFYGAGPNRIKQEAIRLGYGWDDQHCLTLYRKFKQTYQEVFEYKNAIDTIVLDEDIQSLAGRSHRFKDNPEQIYMKCFNTLIQGSASDLVLISAKKCMDEFKINNIDGHFLLAVHDELIFELREDQVNKGVEVIKKCMTDYNLPTKHGNIPLAVEGAVNRQWRK